MGIQLTDVSTHELDTCVHHAKKCNFRNLMKKEIPKMDYLSHNIHPYTAKLIPQIPSFYLRKYAQKECIVLDPFCGSGTSLLEAARYRKEAIGIDLNQLAVLISEVKTTPIDSEELNTSLRLVKDELTKGNYTSEVDFPNRDYWFCKEAQNELCQIRGTLESLRNNFDEKIYRFLLVCFSSTIRKSSYADPRIAKVYMSKRVRSKINRGWIPTPIRYFTESLDRNAERIKRLSEHLGTSCISVRVFHGDARSSSKILKENGIERVDFVMTSPPYINAQDYYRSYKLETWWLGLATPEEYRCLGKRMIGSEHTSGVDYRSEPESRQELVNLIIKKICRSNEKTAKRERNQNKSRDMERENKRKSYIVNRYFQNMEVVFEELSDLMDIGGLVCLVSGNNTISGIQIPTYEILINIAAESGFELLELTYDEIANRSLPPNRNHNCGMIKEEWITVFKKVC